MMNDLDMMKADRAATLATSKETIAIEMGVDGFTVHHWKADSVMPATTYATPGLAAARVLQLLQLTEAVTPQDHPEIACIGSINTDQDEP